MRLVSSSSRVLAVAVVLGASVAVASAQTGAKQEAREQKQDAKSAAAKSGNAIKDSWITLKVHSQFVPDAALENSDIDVDTKAGVVTLSGTVTTAAGRTRAVALAKGTEGVTSVNDKLRVVADPDTAKSGATATNTAREAGQDAKAGAKQATGTAGRTVTDGWIKSKIAGQYVTENSLDNSDIDIDVTKGNVVLNGAVRTAAAKDRATALAKATDGVKDVKNNLRVDANAK